MWNLQWHRWYPSSLAVCSLQSIDSGMTFAKNGLQDLDFSNTTTLTVHCSLFAVHPSTRQGSFGVMLLTCIVTHFCEAPLARCPWFLQGAHLDSATAWTVYFLKLRPWISATSELQSWSFFPECAMVPGEDYLEIARRGSNCFFFTWLTNCWLTVLWLVCIIMASNKWTLAANFFNGKNLLANYFFHGKRFSAQPLCSLFLVSLFLCPMALLQSLRDVATSSVHGVFAHWEVDLILDRIKSFLADDEVLRYYRENPPQKEEPTVTERTMAVESLERTMERTVVRTWSSAPSTPRGGTSRRCMQVADEIPVDENWTITLNVGGRATPNFGTLQRWMDEQWMSWWYLNGLCYRSLLTTSSSFTVHCSNVLLWPPDTERRMFFYHAKWQWWTVTLICGKSAPAAMTGKVWQQPQHAQSWCQYFWLGLDMLPDAGIRRHVANALRSLFTVPCPLKFFVQCPVHFPWVVWGLKQKSWTSYLLFSCFSTLQYCQLRNAVFFSMIRVLGEPKSRLVKAVGAESCGQSRNQNWMLLWD